MAHRFPTHQQLAWQDLEVGMFCHFGMSTFTGHDWSEGTEDPALFNPIDLDCRQWIRAAKRGGMRYAVLTAKHIDGFCLWPTRTTDHCVRRSPWKAGTGDVVREFVDACHAEGVLPGLYCAPWDRNAACYAVPAAYSAFYEAQVEELCSAYGPLVELWFDGAGLQGRTFDWERIMATVRRLQPDVLVLHLGDPDIRWGGSETGYASPDLWTFVDESRADVVWEPDRRLLSAPGAYLPAEIDTVINRAGWFWHPESQGQIRSLEELIGVYYRSVGHGANLLLNLAPNRSGRLEESEVERLALLADEVTRRFGQPLGSVANALDVLEIDLQEPRLVARFEAMEDLRDGENVQEWVLEAALPEEWPTSSGHIAWHRLACGYMLGHKRLGDFAPIVTQHVRLRVVQSRGAARLRSLRVFGP